MSTDASPEPRAAEPEHDQPELERRVARSSLFTIGGYAASNVLRLGSNVLLAQMLLPEIFGQMVLVGLLLLGIGMFSDVGIGPCIVQSARGRDAAFVRTAFTVQALRGVTIAFVGCLIAPAFAGWYGEPDLVWPIRVACATAVFQGLNSTKWFTVTRDLALGRKTVVELVAQVASIAVCVVWAYLDRSVWALVAGSITQSVVIAVGSHLALPGVRDGLKLEREALTELFGFGRWVFVSTCVTFLALQSDRLVLGKLVDSLGLLGVYGMAATIATIPTILAGHLSGNVQFPLLAAHDRRDRGALAEAFLRQRETLLVALGTALLAVFWFAPLFFRTLYPVEFADAGWIAQWICAAGWFALLKQTSDRVLLVRGRTRALAGVNFVAFLAKSTGAIVGFQLAGMHGFLAGLVMGSAVEQLVVQRVVRELDIDVRRQDLMASLVAAAVVGAGWQVRTLVDGHLVAGAPALALEIGLGAVLIGLVAAQTVVRYRRVGLA